MSEHKLDPKIKQITNEFNKEIRMTEHSTEFHLNEDASTLILDESKGIKAESKLTVTILSKDSDILLKAPRIELHSEGPIALTGQASGIQMDKDLIQIKAPLVSQSK